MERGDQQSVEGQQEIISEETSDILAPTAKSLIAIGAAAALNCQPCLNYLIPTAIHNGLLEEEIKATISVVELIRLDAAGFTDKVVTDRLLQRRPAGDSKRECC